MLRAGGQYCFSVPAPRLQAIQLAKSRAGAHGTACSGLRCFYLLVHLDCRAAIHEAMEQQSTHVAKAGMMVSR